jgi:Leucine-rich repeat (LRR) protein
MFFGKKNNIENNNKGDVKDISKIHSSQSFVGVDNVKSPSITSQGRIDEINNQVTAIKQVPTVIDVPKPIKQIEPTLTSDINKQQNLQTSDLHSPNIAVGNLPQQTKPMFNSSPILPKTIVNNENNTKISSILKLTSSFSSENLDYLTCLYVNDIVKVDILSNDDDLANIVATNSKLKYLDISDCKNITNFSIIANLNEIEQLDLSNCELTDFSFLLKLKKIKVLNFTNTRIEDLSVLKEMSSLEVLSLKFTKIKTLSGIENCTELKEISLSGCVNLRNIVSLSACPELRALNLSACSLVKDITFFKTTNKIMFLNLNWTTIEEISPVIHLSNLVFFTMDFCKIVLTDNSLTSFSNLKNLKYLCLRNRGIRNVSFLQKLTSLLYLDISGNMFSDISPLLNLIELRELNISANIGVTNIEPLKNMDKMENLNISGLTVMPMMISNIDVLSNMPNLKIIKASHNKKIKDIYVLSTNTKIEEVYFDYCISIADLTPLRFCPNIKQISFEGDPMIKYYSFLRTTNVSKLNLQKTTIDQIYMSGFTSSFPEFKVDPKPDAILQIINECMKFNKKLSSIIKTLFQKY